VPNRRPNILLINEIEEDELVSLEAMEVVSEKNVEAAFHVLRELRTTLTLDKFKELVRKGECKFRVFEVDSEVVGVVSYRVMETITRGVHMHVHDLVISSAFRNLGYGNKIIEILAKHCEANKLSWIFLDSVPTAIGFYQKLNFEDHAAKLMKRRIQ
jgi:ribosomal protein S18 acetylase RimI-like enzyme